jgi:hypothetical protein
MPWWWPGPDDEHDGTAAPHGDPAGGLGDWQKSDSADLHPSVLSLQKIKN